jgi:hypothetical protein
MVVTVPDDLKPTLRSDHSEQGLGFEGKYIFYICITDDKYTEKEPQNLRLLLKCIKHITIIWVIC